MDEIVDSFTFELNHPDRLNHLNQHFINAGINLEPHQLDDVSVLLAKECNAEGGGEEMGEQGVGRQAAHGTR